MKSDEILANILKDGKQCIKFHEGDEEDFLCPESAIVGMDYDCGKCWLDWARKEAKKNESTKRNT